MLSILSSRTRSGAVIVNSPRGLRCRPVGPDCNWTLRRCRANLCSISWSPGTPKHEIKAISDGTAWCRPLFLNCCFAVLLSWLRKSLHHQFEDSDAGRARSVGTRMPLHRPARSWGQVRRSPGGLSASLGRFFWAEGLFGVQVAFAAGKGAEKALLVNRRSIGTPYRRAKGTPLLSWWVVDAGRGFRAAGGVGRA